jgi:lysophospholipase L1-like esterase
MKKFSTKFIWSFFYLLLSSIVLAAGPNVIDTPKFTGNADFSLVLNKTSILTQLGAEQTVHRAAANGYASLDTNSKLPITQFNFSSPLVNDGFGVLTVQNADTTHTGALTNTDWNTFNGKENVLTFSSPLSRSGNIVSIPAASNTVDGYLLHTDWAIFNAKQSALTFGTGLTNTSGTVTVNSSQNITTLSNLTSAGFVKTNSSGLLSVDTSVYLTGNQTISLSGDISGSGATSITTAIGTNKVVNSMLAQAGASTLKGNNTGGTANVADLTVSQVKTMLALNNVENTALSTWAGTTNITTLGTVTSGTWSGTVIADNKIASALTGKTYNGLTLTANTTGFTISGGSTNSKNLVLNNSITFAAANDTSTLNIGTGGTLGSAAYTASSAYEVPLTFSAPLSRATNTISIPAATTSVNGYLSSTDWTTFNNKQSALTFSTGLTNASGTITVNTSQNITTLSNLTSAGFVKTSAAGLLSVDTNTYLTGNQTIGLAGDVTGNGATLIDVTLATVTTAGTSTKIAFNAKGLVTGGAQAQFSDIGGTATNAQLPSTLSSKTLDDTNTVTVKGNAFTIENSSDSTAKAVFSALGISTGTTRTITIPDANSTTVQSLSAVSHKFVTSMSSVGLLTAAQPTFADLASTPTTLSGYGITDAADLGANVFTGVNQFTQTTYGASVGDKIALYGAISVANYGFSIDNSQLQIHTSSSGSKITFGYGHYGAYTETGYVDNSAAFPRGFHTDGAFISDQGASNGLVLYDRATSTSWIAYANSDILNFFAGGLNGHGSGNFEQFDQWGTINATDYKIGTIGSQTPYIIFVGDSLTFGYTGGTASPPSNSVTPSTINGQTPTKVNVGYNGRQAYEMVHNTFASGTTANAETQYNQNTGLNLAVVMAGTNDIGTIGNKTVAETYQLIAQLCQHYRSLGFKVVICTLPAGGGNAGTGAGGTYDAARITLNGYIRAGWGSFADYMADVGSDATIGNVANVTNTTYFNADHLHLTAAGYAIIAGYEQTAVNAVIADWNNGAQRAKAFYAGPGSANTGFGFWDQANNSIGWVLYAPNGYASLWNSSIGDAFKVTTAGDATAKSFTGTYGGLGWNDQTTSAHGWVWYATGDVTRLWNSTNGDVLDVFWSGGVNVGGNTDPGANNFAVAGYSLFGDSISVPNGRYLVWNLQGANGVFTYRANQYGGGIFLSGVSGRMGFFFAPTGVAAGGSATLTEKMDIFPSGGVSIGVISDPAGGNVRLQGTGTNGWIQLAYQNVKGGIVFFGNDGTRYLEYNTTSNAYNFNGASLIVNGTTYTSDVSMKQNISDWAPETTKSSDKKFVSLQPRKYQRLETPDKDEVGFVANEVEKVLPEAVKPIPPDPKTGARRLGIDPMVIIAKHEKEIQMLESEIEKLKAAQPHP